MKFSEEYPMKVPPDRKKASLVVSIDTATKEITVQVFEDAGEEGCHALVGEAKISAGAKLFSLVKGFIGD